jgi:hypothetical protein
MDCEANCAFRMVELSLLPIYVVARNPASPPAPLQEQNDRLRRS